MEWVESVRNVTFNWKLWKVLVSKDRCLRQREFPAISYCLVETELFHAELSCSYTLLWEVARNALS